MNEIKKSEEYTVKICAVIQAMFDETSDSEFHIDPAELEQGDNATEFFYALGALAPAFIYVKFSGDDRPVLEFNHLMNRLIFQNTKLIK